MNVIFGSLIENVGTDSTTTVRTRTDVTTDDI